MKKRRRPRRRNPTVIVASNPARTRAKRAPSAAALAAFRRFHDDQPPAVTDLGPGMPDLVALGELREIVYRPTIGARRGPAFVHRFGRGARLAASIDGKRLFLVPAAGKPFRVDWDLGIIG